MVEMDEYKKKIRVVNDYDVDGVASGHILYSALKRCGADVSIRVPDRFDIITFYPKGRNAKEIGRAHV